MERLLDASAGSTVSWTNFKVALVACSSGMERLLDASAGSTVSWTNLKSACAFSGVISSLVAL
jgi:plastocyanin